MIYVIALDFKTAETQMCNYGYKKAEWSFCGNVNNLKCCRGADCFIIDGANKRKGKLSECYRALITQARLQKMNMHYKPQLILGVPRTKTEDIRNDLYCSW